MASGTCGKLLMNPADLSEEEMDYELTIRNKLYSETEKEKRQRLKQILLEEKNVPPTTPLEISLKLEASQACRKLKEIEEGLKATIQVKWISQLRHWRDRIFRITVQDLAEEEQKVEILLKIKELTRIYKNTATKLMNLSESEFEMEISDITPSKLEGKNRRASRLEESLKFQSSFAKEIKKENRTPAGVETNRTVKKFFADLPRIESLEISGHQGATRKRHEKTEMEKQEIRLDSHNKRGKRSEQNLENVREFKKGTRKNKIKYAYDSSSEDSSSLDSLSSLISTQSSTPSSWNDQSEMVSHRHHREDRFQHYRLDRWGIQFSGDPQGMDVSDFIFQVNELITAERIPNDRFLDQAYILFTGEARRWYFTYKKQYKTWDKFSKNLRIRFGDPNKDHKLLQDIKDRKQRKGESFVAFRSEIEGMFERMTRQYSEKKRLKILRNNMRRWYKTKLSFYKIKSIPHLSMLCQQLDKDSGRIYSKPSQSLKKHIRNVEITSNSSSSSSEEVEVCAFERKTGVQSRERYAQQPNRAIVQGETVTLQEPNSLCWNCRKYGHRWRDCKQPKVIFCHACGIPGVTFFTCTKSHKFPSQATKNEKPEEK